MFGKAGAIGTNRRTVRWSVSDHKRSSEARDNSHLELEPELETGPCLVESSALASLHKHFECTLLVFLSSRHFSHWETGRPLRLISKSCLSVWLHEEVRCPLMQDSLMRVSRKCGVEMGERRTRRVPCKLFIFNKDLLGCERERERES